MCFSHSCGVDGESTRFAIAPQSTRPECASAKRNTSWAAKLLMGSPQTTDDVRTTPRWAVGTLCLWTACATPPHNLWDRIRPKVLWWWCCYYGVGVVVLWWYGVVCCGVCCGDGWLWCLLWCCGERERRVVLLMQTARFCSYFPF